MEAKNSSTSMINRKTLYISVIDNEVLIQNMLVRILNLMNIDKFLFDIEIFDDGIQFFESRRLEKLGEHLLILDGIMPVMDGLEILQKVKSIEQLNVHVIMLSGRKSQSEIEKAFKLGADEYVTKPFGIKVLQEKIHQLIQRME